MSNKQVVDGLRQQYAELAASLFKELRRLETDVRSHLKDLAYKSKEYERIDVECRVKDCESAIDKLRRKEEGRDFIQGKKYCLKQLSDLVGVRVLTFPVSTMESVNEIIGAKYMDWVPDHKQYGDVWVRKYQGKLDGSDIPCEIQIVSALTGRFWDVEHGVLYKPSPAYRGVIEGNRKMRRLHSEVLNKLVEFEAAFEAAIKGG